MSNNRPIITLSVKILKYKTLAVIINTQYTIHSQYLMLKMLADLNKNVNLCL